MSGSNLDGCLQRQGQGESAGGGATRYLITGGAGFIGSHIADALVARGDDVVVLDDFSTGRRANIEHLVASGSAELIEGSVTDAELVDELMAECDCCLHLASAVGVKLVVANPLETLRRIVQGTDVVVSSAARHGKRVLFASTSEVYGKNSDGALHEDSDRVLGSAFKSRWSYAIAKSYGEAIAHGYHREHGADTVVCGCSTRSARASAAMYGMVVPRFVRQAIAGEDVTVYGDGSQSRCFLHVRGRGRGDPRAGRERRRQRPRIQHRQSGADHDSRSSPSGSSSGPARARGSRFVPYEEAYDEGFEELGRRPPDITRAAGAARLAAAAHTRRGPRRRDRVPARGAGRRGTSPRRERLATLDSRPATAPPRRAGGARVTVRVLVTGGGGFIGSHLAAHLARAGLPRPRPRQLRHRPALERERLGGEVELIEGDIQSYERVNKAVAGCEVVLHQAALPSVPRSVQDPLTSNATNVIGTLNVLLAARDHGVRRVVCASSSSVYGSASGTAAKREDDAAVPISPYATAKLAGEGYARSFHGVYGLDTVALRYFNVFGPRQDPTSQYAAVIPNFITALMAGRRPVIFGDGEQSRDFTYVANVVQANMLAMDAPSVAGKVYNVACGERVTLNRLVRRAARPARRRHRARVRGAAPRRRQAFARRSVARPPGARL